MSASVLIHAEVLGENMVLRVHRTRLGERSEDAEGEQHRVECVAFRAVALQTWRFAGRAAWVAPRGQRELAS